MTFSKYVLLVLFVLLFSTPTFSGTQTLTTYYPAPQGNYNKMIINNTLTFKATAGNACAQNGTDVVLVDVGGTLELCDNSGLTTPLNVDGLWTGNGTFMYPTVNQRVRVGGNTDPGAGINFGVTGTAYITSNLTVGGGAYNPANTLYVSGTENVTGNTTLGGTLGVTGTTTLGGGADPLGNTLQVNGTQGVTGNTAIGGTATVTGLTTLKGGTTANFPITICDNTGNNCGTLEIARAADNNYYAVYGP